MIKVNVLNNQVSPLLANTIKQFQKVYYNRSFSERHPELGKMINCWRCGNRHRSSVDHGPITWARREIITLDEAGKPTVILGEEMTQDIIVNEAGRIVSGMKYPKGRIKPHINQKGRFRLNVFVQRVHDRHAQHLPFINWDDALKTARTEVRREMDKEMAEERRFLRNQRKIANRVNRGLRPGGSRPTRSSGIYANKRRNEKKSNEQNAK